MMKNIHRVIIFVGIFLFLPAHSIIANITNPSFSEGADGLDWWVHNDLVSAWDYPPGSARFSPDEEHLNHDSFLSQVFTFDPESQTLSFSVTISYSIETGVFTATLDGINFFTISSEDIPPRENHLDFTCSPLDISGLWGQEVELVFNLNNDFLGELDTYVTLYDLSISTNVQVIPVPGAVALGGIGACIVGWLRRRRSL